ncbi:MAG: flagellar filament capping protein FliD, partial [Herbaspirillum sp.]
SSSSDVTIATGTASSNAAAGQYDVNVTQLAQRQSLAALGQSSNTALLATGSSTLTFQFGTTAGATFTQNPDMPTGTVTIDSSNSSLQGIRDAVNKAGMGVTATIVSDGSASPYRLVLTSDKTGAASSMQISVAGDTAVQNLLNYDPAGGPAGQKLTQTSTAQNTLLTVNGIAVTSASNSVAGAIEGVTLNALKIGTTSISVARDTSTITSNVNSFVKAYNDLNATLKNLTAYDPTTKTGGPLVGDSTVRSIQTALRQMITNPPAGLPSNMSNLSQAGVSFQKDGTLAVDSTKLQSAITNNFQDIGRLFATGGATSDSLIKYTDFTSATKSGSNALNITALASQGNVVGSVPANLNIVAGTNDQLTVTIDNITSTITLPAGAYSTASLSARIQSSINGLSAFSGAGTAVTVTQINGVFSITSNRYGSASGVTISGNGAANLLGASPTINAGTDAAGTINGMNAAGSGQFLTGSDGLKVQVTGGALGLRGTVDFSNGYAGQLSKMIDGFLGSSGLISGRTDGLNRSVADIGKDRATLNTRLTSIEANYRKQYSALDVMLSNMNMTSNYLTTQLAALANLSKQ